MWMTLHLLLLLLLLMVVVQMGGHVPETGCVWRTHRGGGRRGTTTHCGRRLARRRGRLLVLLQQAVDLEPVGAASVAGSTLGHAHVVALPQAARLAGGAVLLVDDALALVLALADGADIVVRSAEEGLQWKRKVVG